MNWTNKKSVWVCVRPNGKYLSFYGDGIPHFFHKRSIAYAMLNNPKHKVARVVKVRVTVESE